MNEFPKVIGVEALAREWRIKPRTLQAWARTGKLPARKAGRLIVFDVRDLDVWFAKLPRADEKTARITKNTKRAADGGSP